LLELFVAYSKFILTIQSQPEDIDELASAVALSSKIDIHASNFTLLPHAISYAALLESRHTPKNLNFITAISDITKDLAELAEIKYIVCSLSHIQTPPQCDTIPVLFIVRAIDMNGLLIRSRKIKSQHMERVSLRIALETDDPIANAKLLIGFCMTNFHSSILDITLIGDIHRPD